MSEATTHSAEERSFAATLLRHGSRVIASQAAETLLERAPDAGKLFGRKAFRGWHDNLSQRISELAAAVEMGSPEIFVRDVTWSTAAFAARDIPSDAVTHSLESLLAAARADLPDDCVAMIEPVLTAGIEASAGEAEPMARLEISSPRGELALEFLKTVLEGKRQLATKMLVDVVRGGADLSEIYEQVLLPVESEIGTMWHLGEVSIPEEHAATEAIRGAMAVLSHDAYANSSPEPKPGAVLVGAVEGDQHDIGVRAVADIIEVAGYTAVYLGANVPTRDLVRACESYEVTAVLLSAAMGVHLPAIQEAIAAVRGASGIRVIVGGGAFTPDPSLAEQIGADGYAADTAEAVRLLNESAK
ncbi:MAG: cobalamin-dependent protein [Planctomycetota bacterium]